MTDKLVATGDPDADAYLRIARDIHVWTVALGKATDLVDDGRPQSSMPWPPAADDRNPLGYENVADVVACAPALIDETWERAHQHYLSVRARDERIAELADLHVGRLWDPKFILDT
ncbi:hypothetical protein AB0F17_08550 [Nonomuraea sp. NPDC026600]|uniref:hypothetical protein n=1 Tax=Nonomuraea sp. NPDC026600 TaxID=3155363 RepID=UPI00340EBCDB